MMKRRDALKTLGGLGAAAGMARFLPGCSSGGDGPHGITTYVYMMMENRSYDHLFGARAMAPESKTGDGLPTPTMFSNLDLNSVAVSSFTPDKDALCALDHRTTGRPPGWRGTWAPTTASCASTR